MALTEAELQTQWRNAIDLLETSRVYFDETLVAATTGLVTVLEESLEGTYTPAALANAAARYRAAASSMLSPGRIAEFLEPLVFEYSAFVTEGSGYRDVQQLMRALYEHLAAGTDRVESRAITYGLSATLGAGNVGNGAMERLTVDENGFDLEACHVETKRFRCRADANSGVLQEAESFEHLGDDASPDSLLRSAFGSGDVARTFIRSKHAGTGDGGSLLNNSSFSTFPATATPKFVGWDQTFGGAAVAADVTQETTNFYRSHPGASTDASLALAMDNAGDTITLKQTVDNMRQTQLDPDRPYFLRLMWNRSISGATIGTLTLRMGSVSASVVLAAQTGWQELLIAAGTNSWFRTFNEDPLDVEVEWAGGTAGTLLIDDVIFAPWDLIDGTYWVLRGNAATPVAWLVDDTLSFTDTGGAPATGKIQWFLFVSGLGYLPSATPAVNFTDPT